MTLELVSVVNVHDSQDINSSVIVTHCHNCSISPLARRTPVLGYEKTDALRRTPRGIMPSAGLDAALHSVFKDYGNVKIRHPTF